MPYIEGIENERRWVKVFDSIGPGTIITTAKNRILPSDTYLVLSEAKYREIKLYFDSHSNEPSDKELSVYFDCWNLTKSRKQVIQANIMLDDDLNEDRKYLLKIKFVEMFLVDGFVQTLDAQ